MNRGSQSCRRKEVSLALCVLLSLLLHVALAWALELLPRGNARPLPRGASAPRHLQVIRTTPVEKKPLAPSPPPPEPEARFAKTSADTPESRPEQVDFIGSRNTRASGEADAPQRRADAPLPSMSGREAEEEIVTFDQERQDGDLEHEGKATSAQPPAPAVLPAAPAPPQPAQAVALGSPGGTPTPADPLGEGAEQEQTAPPGIAAREPSPSAPGEGLKLRESPSDEAPEQARSQPPPAPRGQAEGTEAVPSPAPIRPGRPQVAVYDPSLAPQAQQPGLRTHERRTRSTGRFVFGRRPSLNVAATARGRYEAEIYRRIARMWYAACDEHRGDIIPGSITVSLRLTKNGRIDSMDLVRRRGASLSQQSFSFAAIRRAALPPMPGEVQQGIVGRLYEMILTFHFD